MLSKYPIRSKRITQNDMFWSNDNQDNLYWGTNKNFTPANVESATRGLIEKYGVKNADFTSEIATYQKAITDQQSVYKSLITEETKGMLELAEMLK